MDHKELRSEFEPHHATIRGDEGDAMDVATAYMNLKSVRERIDGEIRELEALRAEVEADRAYAREELLG